MSGKHVVVTGAGGYVGRHVVTALLNRGAVVTAVVRSNASADLDVRARVLEADILDPNFHVSTLAPEPPASVIHLAWKDGFTHNSPSHMLLLSAHFAFLESLAEWGVGRIAVLGTMHEVGYWEGAIDGDTPTAPITLYGIAKDALRRSMLTYVSERAEIAWLRCYYIYGDDRRNHSIFTRILEAVDAGKTEFPFTSGTNKYDFIDVDELAQQIAVVATAAGVVGVVNCCSGEPVSLAKQAEDFITAHSLPITLAYGVFPDREYDSPAVWGDATVIRGLMSRE